MLYPRFFNWLNFFKSFARNFFQIQTSLYKPLEIFAKRIWYSKGIILKFFPCWLYYINTFRECQTLLFLETLLTFLQIFIKIFIKILEFILVFFKIFIQFSCHIVPNCPVFFIINMALCYSPSRIYLKPSFFLTGN